MNYECNVTIELLKPEDIPGAHNSVESVRNLSSEARDILITFKGKKIFSLTVSQTVFNPYRTVAAPILIDMMLKRIIDVQEKRVVDLGCGSGVIGLAATFAGCKSVLYTDINSHVLSIRTHPLFRKDRDRVAIQDFCKNERDASFEVVIMSIPSIVTSKPLEPNSFEPSVYRHPDFISAMIRNAARILVSSGLFVFFYRIYPDQIEHFTNMLIQLNHYFDLDSLKCLLQSPEKKGIATIFSLARK